MHEVTNMTVRMTLNLQYTSTEEHFVSQGHVDMPTLQLRFITIARTKITRKPDIWNSYNQNSYLFLTWLFFMLTPNQVILNDLKLSNFNLSDSSLWYLSSKFVTNNVKKSEWAVNNMFVCMHYITLFFFQIILSTEPKDLFSWFRFRFSCFI